MIPMTRKEAQVHGCARPFLRFDGPEGRTRLQDMGDRVRLVGAQMSWVLRPFIGNPTLPFEWFRERKGKFFIAVFKAIINLFS